MTFFCWEHEDFGEKMPLDCQHRCFHPSRSSHPNSISILMMKTLLYVNFLRAALSLSLFCLIYFKSRLFTLSEMKHLMECTNEGSYHSAKVHYIYLFVGAVLPDFDS